jgi:pyruvate, water dikinase
MSTTILRGIVPFGRVEEDTALEIGGKGLSLGRMTQQFGAVIPRGFIVTTAMYDQAADDINLRGLILDHLGDLDYNDQHALENASRAIQAAFLSYTMPDKMVADLTVAYQELDCKSVAVRSSATAEDGKEKSFAGQNDSFLHVRSVEDFLQKVLCCWASMYGARVISYKHAEGFKHEDVRLAVVVQEMVFAAAGGVMLTKGSNAESVDHVVINAVHGLPEFAVDGSQLGDHYTVDRASLDSAMVHSYGKLTKKLISADVSNGHGEFTRVVNLSEHEASAQVLTVEQICALAKIGLEIENYFGHPCDIEWTLTDSGEFKVVQSRPITIVVKDDLVEAKKETARLLGIGLSTAGDVGTGPVVFLKDASPEELQKAFPGCVIVTEMTTPDFDRVMEEAAGIITRLGTPTCHAALVSGEMQTATVVGLEPEAYNALREGQIVTVDGRLGHVYDGRAEKRIEWYQANCAAFAAQEVVQTVMPVYSNVFTPKGAQIARTNGAKGIGLLRAEHAFGAAGVHPRHAIAEGNRQWWIQKVGERVCEISRIFDGMPVTYRTNDLKSHECRNLEGGDKYEPNEIDPMLGYRGGTRILADKETFEMEMDMLKYVWEQGCTNLRVMIPFVRMPVQLARIRETMINYGLPIGVEGGMPLGFMVELPTNVILLEEYAAAGAQFCSVGSNDLEMLTKGITRDGANVSPELSNCLNGSSPDMLWMYKTAAEKAKVAGIAIGFCGNGPSADPELARLLVKYGYDSISVLPSKVKAAATVVAKAEAT